MSMEGRARAADELDRLTVLARLTAAVVHGDLGGENVLWEWLDGVPRLVGVIDWDAVVLGDQAEDSAALPEQPEIIDRVDAIRRTFALQQALFALRDGDQVELADGLAGYR